jgi:predicted O-methyltransferase YrrM
MTQEFAAQEFTTDWLRTTQLTWDQLLPQFKPRRILEVGSYEGASTCYAIKLLSGLVDHLEIHCVDTWEGGIEHQLEGIDMAAIEARFKRNVAIEIDRAACTVDLHIHKSTSAIALAKLIADGKAGYFDFAYVDGSHQATDVLTDAVLSFQLVRHLGIIGYDDYLWKIDPDPLQAPKIAIDAFTNVFSQKVVVIPNIPLYQLYVSKIEN